MEVGFSLTVANGLVPLYNTNREEEKERRRHRVEKTDIVKYKNSNVFEPSGRGYNKRGERCISNCTHIIWKTEMVSVLNHTSNSNGS